MFKGNIFVTFMNFSKADLHTYWIVWCHINERIIMKYYIKYSLFCIHSLHPLFPGSNEVDQIARIHSVLGTPSPNILKKLQKWVELIKW